MPENKSELERLAETAGIELDEQDYEPLTLAQAELVNRWRQRNAIDKTSLITEGQAKLIRAIMRREGLIKPQRVRTKPNMSSGRPSTLGRRRGSVGGGERPKPYKDTSVRKREPDPTPKKDWDKEFAGIRKADKIWNEPEAIQQERWEEPPPDPDMTGLDEYEETAAEHIEEYGHPDGRQGRIDEELQRQRELTNLEWILQERIEAEGQATAMPQDPILAENPALINQNTLADPMLGLDDPMGPKKPEENLEDVPPEALD